MDATENEVGVNEVMEEAVDATANPDSPVTPDTATFIDDDQAAELKEQLTGLGHNDIKRIAFMKEQERIRKKYKVKAKAKRKAQKMSRRRNR